MDVDIPGRVSLKLEHLVFDYNGTVARDGILLSNLGTTLLELSKNFTIHVLTADTCGTAEEHLKDLPCRIVILKGDDTAIQKENYVKELGPETVVSIGNGYNDRLMLREACIGIAVIEGEGASSAAIQSSDLVARSIYDALGMLLIPKRIVAALRS